MQLITAAVAKTCVARAAWSSVIVYDNKSHQEIPPFVSAYESQTAGDVEGPDQQSARVGLARKIPVIPPPPLTFTDCIVSWLGNVMAIALPCLSMSCSKGHVVTSRQNTNDPPRSGPLAVAYAICPFCRDPAYQVWAMYLGS